MKKLFLNTLLFLFLAIVMAVSVRGLPGNPSAKELNVEKWKDNGPMELSPERGRYALLYSIVEDKSFTFSLDLAKFSTPDVGYQNGKYASLFAPGVSFLAVPGYYIGKYFGAAQVGAFSMIALFAIFNAFLIRSIAVRLGAHPLAGTIGGISFLFASPAFAYAVSLYQHHMSTFLILAALYLLIGKKKDVIPTNVEGSDTTEVSEKSGGRRFLGYARNDSEAEDGNDARIVDGLRQASDESRNELRNRKTNFFSLAGIWALFALSIPVDYPNLFLMLPIAVAAIAKTIMFYKKPGEVTIHISFLRGLAMAAVILPLTFFTWFNTMSYGNPLQLSGTLERVLHIEDNKPLLEGEVIREQLKKSKDPREDKGKSALGFFQNRTMANGFYTHIFSPDRGMLMFTPLMFLGILGMIVAFRSASVGAPLKRYAPVLLAIIGFNVVLYSMWEDPYGGWAFGSRYMIPSYAILSVFIALALTRYARYNLLLLMFFMLFVYSTGVNTLGAITTNRNPPKIETDGLEKKTGRHEEYTYLRNVGYLGGEQVKSFVFEAYAANKMTAWTYYTGIVMGIVSVMAGMILMLKYQMSNIKYQMSNARQPKHEVSGRSRGSYVNRTSSW